jgi:hypothetical protein
MLPPRIRCLRAAKTAGTKHGQTNGGMAIVAISLWKLAWVITPGGLAINGTVEATVEEVSSRFAIRPITAKIAALASQFGPDYYERSMRSLDRRHGAR